MNILELKKLIREVIDEEQDYQMLFKSMLDKSGKDINSMSDEDKKKFFTAVDKAYKAKTEGRLSGYNDNLKKKINEDLTGVVSVLTGIILGKVIFYWIGELFQRFQKWLNEPDLKENVKTILKDLSNDKSFISTVSKMVDDKNGIDNDITTKIVKLDTVQNLINREIKKDKNINKTTLENSIKTVFLKAWSDNTIMNIAVNKVKTDIK